MNIIDIASFSIDYSLSLSRLYFFLLKLLLLFFLPYFLRFLLFCIIFGVRAFFCGCSTSSCLAFALMLIVSTTWLVVTLASLQANIAMTHPFPDTRARLDLTTCPLRTWCLHLQCWELIWYLLPNLLNPYELFASISMLTSHCIAAREFTLILVVVASPATKHSCLLSTIAIPFK